MSSGSDFRVPEPPSGIDTGFLTPYWQYRKPLPSLKGVEVAAACVQRGIRTLFVMPMSNFIAITTIAISLFLLSGFMLLLLNIDHLLSQVGNTLSLSAYLKDGAKKTEIEEFIAELEKHPKVSSVDFISKEKALELFKQDLETRSGFLAGLEGNNPLPASVDIFLYPDKAGVKSASKMIESIRSREFVEEVVFGSEWVEKAQGVLKVFRLLGLATFLVTLAVIIFLMANTIKLVVFARREEVSIMKLVGASDMFVRIPFVVGGIVQGIIGSVLGLLFLKLASVLINHEIRHSAIFGIALPKLAFLDWQAAALIVFVGLVVGALGSLFALGKFVNV